MSRRTFNIPGHVHFLTFSCYHRLDLLTSAWACQLLGDALRKACETSYFDLWAYVFMPNHVHLVVRPRHDNYSMAAIQRSFKEPFAREFVAFLKRHDPQRLEPLRFKTAPNQFHRV